ncbi:MAG TPA: hypothetical protein VFY17_01065 [Pilimelia sp.]|nr:hypothetical protein [Pilimelia sp.]
MTRSTHRRAAGLLAGAAATALALTGCSAGQIARTALKEPGVAGAQATQVVAHGEVSVRDVQVIYGTQVGYPRGGSAPVGGGVYNDTTERLTVRVGVEQPAADAGRGVVAGTGVTLTEGKLPTPAPGTLAPGQGTGHAEGGHDEPAAGGGLPEEHASPSAGAQASPPPSPTSPPAPAGGGGAEATFDLPSRGYLIFGATQGQYLMVTGLRAPLRAGMSVPLRFTFSNGVVLRVTAPVANPLSPLPRVSGTHGGAEEH